MAINVAQGLIHQPTEKQASNQALCGGEREGSTSRGRGGLQEEEEGSREGPPSLPSTLSEGTWSLSMARGKRRGALPSPRHTSLCVVDQISFLFKCSQLMLGSEGQQCHPSLSCLWKQNGVLVRVSRDSDIEFFSLHPHLTPPHSSYVIGK